MLLLLALLWLYEYQEDEGPVVSRRLHPGLPSERLDEHLLNHLGGDVILYAYTDITRLLACLKNADDFYTPFDRIRCGIDYRTSTLICVLFISRELASDGSCANHVRLFHNYVKQQARTDCRLDYKAGVYFSDIRNPSLSKYEILCEYDWRSMRSAYACFIYYVTRWLVRDP